MILPSASTEEILQEITVKDGDTLWGIANYYLKDPNRWPDILKHNNLPLTDPAVALPGMKLKVPVLLIKEHLRKASLIWMLNDVKYRKKDQPTWKKAIKDIDLYNEDGLRTMEDSQAHVKFFSGDILRLDENSLVILRPELKVEEVNLLSGALRTAKTKVITPTAQVTPKTQDTVYKTRIRQDRSTVVQVEKGSAEVLGLDTGKTVIVPAGHANITIPNKAPSLPVQVPQMPEFRVAEFSKAGDLIPLPAMEVNLSKDVSTAKDDISAPKEYAPTLEKLKAPDYDMKDEKKKKFKDWKAYRIVVARDSQFTQIVYDRQKEISGTKRPTTDIKEYNLPDGRYYRRISWFDDGGKESTFSPLPPSPFEIDSEPPKIILYSPEEGSQTREGLVSIEGQTEPSCFVTINNYPVPVRSDGRFYWSAVLATEGPNKIRITAKDKLNNKSFLERTVYLVGGARR